MKELIFFVKHCKAILSTKKKEFVRYNNPLDLEECIHLEFSFMGKVQSVGEDLTAYFRFQCPVAQVNSKKLNIKIVIVVA